MGLVGPRNNHEGLIGVSSNSKLVCLQVNESSIVLRMNSTSAASQLHFSEVW
jgi:hypothetical protein